jgi:hypothetical protein
VDDPNWVSRDPVNMDGSASSIYAKGELKDAADMAESGCGELNDIGVVVRVNQPFPEVKESGLVLLLVPPDWVARLRERLSGCDVRCSPTRGDVETVIVVSSMPRLWQSTRARQDSLPKSSGRSPGP